MQSTLQNLWLLVLKIQRVLWKVLPPKGSDAEDDSIFSYCWTCQRKYFCSVLWCCKKLQHPVRSTTVYLWSMTAEAARRFLMHTCHESPPAFGAHMLKLLAYTTKGKDFLSLYRDSRRNRKLCTRLPGLYITNSHSYILLPCLGNPLCCAGLLKLLRRLLYWD